MNSVINYIPKSGCSVFKINVNILNTSTPNGGPRLGLFWKFNKILVILKHSALSKMLYYSRMNKEIFSEVVNEFFTSAGMTFSICLKLFQYFLIKQDI